MFTHGRPSTHAMFYTPSSSAALGRIHPEETPTAPVDGIAILKSHISERSMLQGIVCEAPATCHPETRRGTLTTILSWVNKPSPHESVLWVYGSEGVGKSAIMQTIATIVTENHRDRYAGGYFISAGTIYTRCESRTFIPTLAYQMAGNLPGMYDIIESAMINNPDLPMELMQTQLEQLIIMPLQQSSIDFSHHTPLIVIDGLDECEEPDTLKQITSIISRCVAISVPLRFLIAGRPVGILKEAFSRDPLLLVTKEICLDSTDNNMQVQTDADIERFYNAEFASIYDKKWLRPLSSITRDIPKPWPSTDDIRLLTFSASGNFLYASTITAYIRRGFRELGDPYMLFQKLLRTIRTFRSTLALDITELDILYMSILSLYPRQESLMAVLAGVLLRFHPNVIEALFQVEEREIQTVLKYLDPLLKFDNKEQKLEDHNSMANIFRDLGRWTINVGVIQGHRSFREFLLNPRRSGAAFHPKFISNNRSPDLIDTIKNARSTYANMPLVPFEFARTGFGFWTKDFLCIAAHSLPGIWDNDVLPPLLTLFFESRYFLLGTLAKRDVNSLIPETASLLIFLHHIQRHTEYLGFADPLPEDVLLAVKQMLFPKTVGSTFLPDNLEKIMDALQSLMDKYPSGEAFSNNTSSQTSRTGVIGDSGDFSSQKNTITTNTVPSSRKGSEAITISKSGKKSESHYVYYGTAHTYPSPSATPGRIQSGKGTSAVLQSCHGEPSSPRFSSKISSSSSEDGSSIAYSHASSRTKSTDYGFFYRRRDIS